MNIGNHFDSLLLWERVLSGGAAKAGEGAPLAEPLTRFLTSFETTLSRKGREFKSEVFILLMNLKKMA